LIFSVLVGSAFFIGGLIGILTRTLAFLPILSDFVGLKDYDKNDELMFSIGILINTFTLFIGFAMLINVFIELL